MTDSLSAMLEERPVQTGVEWTQVASASFAARPQSRQAPSLKDQIMRDLERRNYAGALKGLQKAHAVARKNTEIMRWLVAVANDADDLFLARKFARRLVETEPNVAVNHVFLGTVLDRLGKTEDAIKAFRKADRLQPGVPKTLMAIGRAYATTGKHDEALRYFGKALEADPYNDAAIHNSAQSKKYGEEEALELVRQAEAALPHAKANTNKARLHFAAGKVLDDIKRHDEAFAHFKAANDLVNPEKPRDMSITFRNTRNAFPDAAFFEARKDIGASTERPIFIVGMPRSGTTLTESLCAAHSLVTAGDEQTAMGALAAQLGRDAAGDHYQRLIASLSTEHAEAFANAYLEHCEQTVGTKTPRFTDKMPHNFLNVGLIALLFPNAKIIHCRRHPLDSCLSLYSKHMAQEFHLQYKADLARLGEHCREYLDLMDHWHSVLPGRVHDLYYEDLVANTELNARAIMDFLGLEWEDRVMQRSDSQHRVATASQWQVRQPVYQSSKGRWRRYEKHLGPLIEAIGQERLDAYEQGLAALDHA
ncbi:tetratricopeptide repeat-containing sulfotransferase family protein [Oricola thermophila]|uniref:Sulfotransferase n=1 Tax=Oricola thermophila TaxID=2742145 RepID=A0A6N1VFD2_9HYPH|nr:sulfotransferase [Oricola thermophila]QKV19636.1 sulfotransferase [Oricola thermophila]